MLPVIGCFWVISGLTSKDQALASCSQAIAHLPGRTGCYLRSAFYAVALDEFHRSARLEYGTLLSKSQTRIERNVYVGPYCLLGLVTLRQDVLLGPAVQIPSGRHTHGTARLDLPIRNQPGRIERITIGRDCWVGAQSIVLSDIDEQTIVGAGSVVTHPLPTRVVATGNPAAILRHREDSQVNCEE